MNFNRLSLASSARAASFVAMAAVIGFPAVPACGQLIIDPTIAAVSSQVRPAAWAVDGSGLAAGPSGQLGASDSTHNNIGSPYMWTSYGNINGVNDFSPWITFALLEVSDLQVTRIWNYNETAFVNIGAKDIRISTSPDNENFDLVGEFTLAIAGGSAAEPAQDFATPATGVRYVRFDILDNYDGAVFDGTGGTPGTDGRSLTGLAEVRFEVDGTARAPIITSPPASWTVNEGDNVTFSVVVDGTAPLSFQWQKDGADLSNATNLSLKLTQVGSTDGGDYTVAICNVAGCVTSSPPATLTIVPPATSIMGGLAVYWNFDDGTGLALLDHSGNFNDGTLFNYAGDDSQWVPGQVGGALQFGGPAVRNWVLVPSYPQPVATMAACAWVWADARPQWASIIKNFGNSKFGQFHFGLELNAGDLSNYITEQGRHLVGPAREGTPLPLGSWQHVAFVCDGSKMRIYRNGVEVGATSYNGTLVNPSPLQGIAIGSKLNDTGIEPEVGFWQGKMDEIGLWGRKLSPTEVMAVYLAGLNGQPLTNADAFMTAIPTISQQPQGVTRYAGEGVRFSVAASSTISLAYEWRKDGATVPQATNNVLTFDRVSTAKVGEYTVVVSNAGGSVTSAPAALVVLPVAGIVEGLAGYWKFDEGSGDVFVDHAGYGNDGTLYGFPGDNSQWVSGQVGGAVHFGGPDTAQYGMVPDYPKPSSTMTIAAWVLADARPTWASIAKNWSGTRNQFYFGLDNVQGDLSSYLVEQNGTQVGPVREGVAAPLPIGSWQHVAFVCDGNQMRLYRNGALVGVVPYAGTINTNLGSSALAIGAKLGEDNLPPASVDSGYWQGNLDDLGLWTRGLTPEEILAIYVAGANGRPLTDAVSGAVPPAISGSPQGQNVTEGDQVRLGVVVAGTPPLAYQWRRNGAAIVGATNAAFQIASACTGLAGDYDVVICNVAGCVTSAPPAALGVAPLVISGPLNDGLVGYWTFDDGAGLTLADHSGNGNNGVLHEFPTDGSQWVVGRVGGALHFSGREYVLVPSYPQPTATMAVCAWVWADSRPTWASIVKNFGNSKFGQFHFGLEGDAGDLSNYITQQDGQLIGPVREGTPFPRNSWQHVAFVCDGTQLRIYRNGNQVGAQPYDGTLINPSPLQSLAIGTKTDDTGNGPTSPYINMWQGNLDDLGLWNRALSTAEIQAIYSAGLEGRALPSASVLPTLTIRQSGANLVFSWPAIAAGPCYTLEAAPSLPASSWTSVGAPTVAGDQCSVTFPAPAVNTFYRLKK